MEFKTKIIIHYIKWSGGGNNRFSFINGSYILSKLLKILP